MDGTRQAPPEQPSIAKLLKEVRPAQETILDLEREALGEGKDAKKVTLVLKQQDVAPLVPVRAESEARSHIFHEVDGFARYLQKFAGKSPVIFADVPGGVIFAVLDEDADKGREQVAFLPQIHPRWAPFEEVLNKTLELPEFVDFVRNNRRSLVKPDGRELCLALSQVKASREVTIHQGKGKTSLNGLLVKLNIQGQDKSEPVELPDELTVRAPIYVGLKDSDQVLDLVLDASESDGVLCHLSAGDLLEARTKAFEEITEKLKNMLTGNGKKDEGGKAFTFTLGRPAWKEWRYLAPSFRPGAGPR